MEIKERHLVRGIKVLARVLKRARWDDQGGYPSYNNGKWSFISSGLPQATPEEWDALFALAGIVPDEIVSKGSCEDCSHAKVLADGSRAEKGYVQPCLSCKRPSMSNFEPLVKIGA
jgi:hypothetical protein